MSRLLLIIFCILSFTSCGLREKIENAGRVPVLSNVNESLELKTETQNIQYHTTSNSLWRPGSRSFFHDSRARGVGDILKIVVNIQDSAQIDNQNNFNRSSGSSVGIPNFLGLEEVAKNIFPNAFSAKNLLNLNSSDSFTGVGKVDRKEVITTVMSATVINVLENGNLRIKGSQEILINNERRKLTVEGVIQPGDISATNSVNSEQIAEARIYYGGDGDISEYQREKYGKRLLNALNPF